LFGPLKHHLSAQHFPDDEAAEREVTAWFRQQPKEFYAAGIFQISTLICLSSISICNLLIDLPSYIWSSCWPPPYHLRTSLPSRVWISHFIQVYNTFPDDNPMHNIFTLIDFSVWPHEGHNECKACGVIWQPIC
jgi:hypothetical protein